MGFVHPLGRASTVRFLQDRSLTVDCFLCSSKLIEEVFAKVLARGALSILSIKRTVVQIGQEIDQCVPRKALESELGWG